jgi:purine-binding chemotaxis protein CheW
MSINQSKSVIFRLGNQQFGIPIEQVVSIERMQPITQVPQMSHYICGIIHLRGNIIPLVDLYEALMERRIEETDATRIVVVTVDGNSVGLIVDEATDVMDINLDSIQSVEAIRQKQLDILLGVVKVENQLILLLDAVKLVSNLGDQKQIKYIKEQVLT